MLVIGLVMLVVIGICIKVFDDKIRPDKFLKSCVVYVFFVSVLFVFIGIIQLFL